MKKALSVLLSVLLAAGACFAGGFAASAESSYTAQLTALGFPYSYAQKLAALKEKYPNWVFEPMQVGVELDEAVANERTPHSQQLIQKYSGNNGKGYYCTCSSCYKNGNYVIQEGSSWVSASESAVEYYMDPANFLDEKYIFQFEKTSYDSSQTTAGIETIIKNTWMHDSLITYKDASGKTHTYTNTKHPNGAKYSEAILDAAQYSGLSAYYLASRIVQEVGGKTNSAGGASGTNSSYPGIYNYYNIGANTGALDGLKWASVQSAAGYKTNCNAKLRASATTASDHIITIPEGTLVTILSTTGKQSDGYIWHQVSVKVDSRTYTGYVREDLIEYSSGDKYGRPWTNPYISIYNGAKYIANNFSSDQNTGYLQKFNVNPKSDNMYSHEYMANVQAPSSEALNTYKAYSEMGLLGAQKTFVIPVFKNTDPSITGVTVFARGDGGTDLYLKWDPVSGATEYSVYIVSGSSSVLKGKTTETQFVFTDLTPGWEYDVLITANDSENSTSELTTVCAAPGNINGLEAQLKDANTVFLSWESPGCHGYLIEWATNSDFTENKGSVTVSGDRESFELSLKDASQYYIRMRAWKTSGGETIYGEFTDGEGLQNRLYMPSGFNVYARGDGGTDLYLKWNAVSGAEKYDVYIISGENKILKGSAGEPNFTFTDLTPGWEYEVRVEASGGAKSSAANTVVCAAPADVEGFAAEIINEDRVELSWQAQAGLSYLLQYSKTGQFEDNVSGTELSQGSSKYTLSIKDADEYRVRLRAWKTHGNEKIYGSFTDVIDLSKMLPTPKDFEVTGHSSDGTQLTLKWSAVSGADGYRVYIVSQNGNILKGTVNTSSFTFTDLTPGWEYDVLVEAYSSEGRSSQGSFTVEAGLGAVTGVKANKNSDGSINITWNDAGADGYNIQWAKNSSFTSVAEQSEVSGSALKYTLGASYDGYYVRVRAWKNSGSSRVYGEYSDALDTSYALSAATGFNVYARGGNGKDLYLEWTGDEMADGYRVYVVSGGGDVYKGTVENNRFTFTDFTPGWEYDVKVVSYNSVSTVGATYRVCAALAQTQGVTAAASNGAIAMSWDEMPCHGYLVQWSTDESFGTVSGSATINGSANNSYTITGLDSGKVYYVRARAWRNFGSEKVYGAFSKAALAAAAPVTPSDFNVYARGDGGTDLYLEWSEDKNVDSYRIYIYSGTPGTDSYTETLKGDTTENRFVFTDLNPGWEYNIMVVASNEIGRACAKTVITAAPAPVEYAAATIDGSEVTAIWAVTPGHGYIIQWSTDQSFKTIEGSESISGSDNNFCTFTVNGDPADYYIRVRATRTARGEMIGGEYSPVVKAE